MKILAVKMKEKSGGRGLLNVVRTVSFLLENLNKPNSTVKPTWQKATGSQTKSQQFFTQRRRCYFERAKVKTEAE